MAIFSSSQLAARISQSAAVALIIALSSCDEAAAPEGSPGDLTVAAYIDNDASGTLTAGDTPIPGLDVAVLDDTREVTSGQTGADGRVTFADLAPGSYRIEASGTPPAGATLTSNPSPSAVIDFRGRSVSVDFRYAMFPGVITGRVFRDENDNGTFDPATDIPGPGLWVFLRADTGAMGAKLDSVRTDSLGAYRFGLVAPGSYFLEFEQLGAINYGASGATRQVTVVGAATATQNVLFTGSIFVTIAQARATPVDTTVAVIGDITVPAGVFNGTNPGANSEIWVQDSTGGIAVFSVPTADSAIYRLGTRVEVVGPIGLFNGQKQISRTSIRVRPGGSTVAAKANTVPEARALTDEGELIVVSGLRIVTVGGGTSNAFNVAAVSSANDTLTVRVNGAATGLTRASFIVGERYNITGILTQFNGAAQLKPRFPNDVVQILATPMARVVINELMPDPALASDGAGEWIELYNWGTASIDIQNWKLFGNSTGDTARITSSVVIAPGDYVVLGINGNPTDNGGVTVDFVYRSGYSLNNSTTTGDVVILRDAAGATVDSVVYVSPPNGASMALRDASADNTDAKGSNWQTSTTPYNASDEGTPGSQNDGYITPTQPTPLVQRGGPIAPLNKKQR
ncbi:MAG TPA: lamin tail domain-containing protein [Gemmatimonadaceae bacterium]|nr:lamin tail domain-containing protein [Gemmatimonadaceae bacterium]